MQDKFKNLFDSNYTSLCNYAHAMIKDKQYAEDIVQSIFIQLWQKKKIEELDNPVPYLLQCVRYKCIDYTKKNKRSLELFTEALPEIVVKEQELSDADIMPLLHYFASKLPDRMKHVFLMSRQNGMTYQEIAQDLDISIKTVENHMGAALKKMRALLQKHHYLPVLMYFFV